MRKSESECVYCGERAEHVDHVLPFSKGGTTKEENLVAACATCNMIASGQAFSSFEEKKAFILNRRKGKQVNDQPKRQLEIPVYREEEVKRPAWHRWVYGGMKRKRGER